MTAKEIIRDITKYRTALLVHRYLYYVKADAIVSDFVYDMQERKLRGLIAQYPALAFRADHASYCPTESVGSSNADNYPRRIEQLAESLLQYHKRQECK
jgi:NAD-dependent DNA ligase